ncbi:MAG: ribonuclease D [Coriobacteriales bacterium]|nr:ribonuclease D [Coriobacteriales bacterium]
MYVRDAQGLAELIESLGDAPLIAVDTEFMRERTYYAKLCLVQVATDDLAAIVDPLEGFDLSPLWRRLADECSVKILHAGSQDLEIISRLSGNAPAPVFDTQIAATLAGFPQQVGYAALVRDVLGVTVDKGDTYTDWSRRPLTGTQREYALNDVRFLPEVYRRLKTRLDEAGRMGWLAADFARLADSATYDVQPEEQWRRLKRVSSLNRRQLGVARELAAWREREAQRRDIPKRWVLGDETVVEIARRSPKNVQALADVRGVTDKLPKGSYESVLAAVRRGVEVPEDELPSLSRRKRLASDIEGAVDLMAALVRVRAKESDIAVPLLASRDELERLAAGEREESELLQGWRRAIIGDDLTALLDGRLSVRIEGGALVIEPRPEVERDSLVPASSDDDETPREEAR